MSKKIYVFVDSDVVISSIISEQGAAYALIHFLQIDKAISNYSQEEIKKVSARMNLNKKKTDNIISMCKLFSVKENITTLKSRYDKYVIDINDAHVLAGAIFSKALFLITYNVKHYKSEDVKRDFNVIIMSPGMFLQYLRSKR